MGTPNAAKSLKIKDSRFFVVCGALGGPAEFAYDLTVSEDAAGPAMRPLFSKLLTLAFACFSLAASAEPAGGDTRPVVRIGLVDTFSPDFYIGTYAQTVQYLKKRLPQYRFESVELADDAELSAEQARDLDFLVSSAGTFGVRGNELGMEHIVIRKRSDAQSASQSVAVVFVVRADNKQIRTLADMRHGRAAATTPSSFDGWLIALDAIAQAGFSPDDFFSSVQFTEFNYPDVISRVLVGQADVGVLTRCELENLEQQGVVDASAVRVVNGRDAADEPCRRSSDLYPAEMIAVFPHTDAVLAKEVTIALLQMPAVEKAGASWEWVTVNDLVGISGLLERLSLGSFSYQRDYTLSALASRYWREIILVLGLIAAVIFHILRVDRLVLQRTHELVRAVAEKEALLERMKRTQEYLQLLERNTIVSQLSSLFAHEMKQPLANIINYAGGLRILHKSGRSDAAAEERALEAIDDQAHRMAQIVDRVRAYAKREPPPKSECVLADIVGRMLENFRLAQKSVSDIRVDVPRSIRVMAEPVSLELLFLNLVRNAERAAAKSVKPQVRIAAELSGRTVRVTVSDNGPRVDEELFERLGRIGGVRSTQGLGLGLAIAKGIAENHNGHLEFSRSAAGGLAVTLVMTNTNENEDESREKEPSA